MELSKDEYLRIFNDGVKYGRSIKNNTAADHYFEGAKAEALRSQQLVGISEDFLRVLDSGLSIQPNSALHHCLKDILNQYNNTKLNSI